MNLYGIPINRLQYHCKLQKQVFQPNYTYI
nr:MAG TPA: hypothetical protein [Caudoviricetes sp.]